MLRDVQQIGRDQATVGDHDGDVGLQSVDPRVHIVGLIPLEGGRSVYIEPRVASHGRHR